MSTEQKGMRGALTELSLAAFYLCAHGKEVEDRNLRAEALYHSYALHAAANFFTSLAITEALKAQ